MLLKYQSKTLHLTTQITFRSIFYLLKSTLNHILDLTDKLANEISKDCFGFGQLDEPKFFWNNLLLRPTHSIKLTVKQKLYIHLLHRHRVDLTRQLWQHLPSHEQVNLFQETSIEQVCKLNYKIKKWFHVSGYFSWCKKHFFCFHIETYKLRQRLGIAQNIEVLVGYLPYL